MTMADDPYCLPDEKGYIACAHCRRNAEARGECDEPDTPIRVPKTDAERLSWLRTGLTLVLDLPSDTTDLDILVAVATSRSAELAEVEP
jgi:hypothetical protein